MKIIYCWKLLISLFIISIVSSCSVSELEHNYQLTDKEGLAFFSLSRSGELSGQLELSFSGLNDSGPLKFRLNSQSEIDFGPVKHNGNAPYDQAIGKLFVMRLPEGVYQLNEWRLTKNDGSADVSRPLVKKFRVANHKALYLGNIHLTSGAENKQVRINDRRFRDIPLFLSKYKKLTRSQVLITSGIFLDTTLTRNQLLDDFTSCEFFDGLQIISNRRLPVTAPKFRIIKKQTEEIEISRADGVKLKLAYPGQPPLITNKIEFSVNAKYQEDKNKIKDWLHSIPDRIPEYKLIHNQEGFFDDYIIQSGILKEKHFINEVTSFIDSEHMIMSLTFINPHESIRQYHNLEEFNQFRQQFLSQYQQCILRNLNK